MSFAVCRWRQVDVEVSVLCVLRACCAAQGIIQLLKRLPPESAVEKMQEITYHSFKVRASGGLVKERCVALSPSPPGFASR